jgi:hypothetical protein
MLDLDAIEVGTPGIVSALIKEDRELREEIRRHEFAQAECLLHDKGQRKTIDKLHAEAAGMRMELKREIAFRRTYHMNRPAGRAKVKRMEAALSGDAGKQLAERFEELVEWARRACEQQKQIPVAFGIGVGEFELPECLSK